MAIEVITSEVYVRREHFERSSKAIGALIAARELGIAESIEQEIEAQHLTHLQTHLEFKTQAPFKVELTDIRGTEAAGLLYVPTGERATRQLRRMLRRDQPSYFFTDVLYPCYLDMQVPHADRTFIKGSANILMFITDNKNDALPAEIDGSHMRAENEESRLKIDDVKSMLGSIQPVSG